MKEKDPFRFYIYAYLRYDLTPYYIGKGTGRRRFDDNRTINKPVDDKFNIIVEDGLTELGAFARERYYIRWFGKKCDGSGILRNVLDGGDGMSSADAKHISKKTLENGNHPFKGHITCVDKTGEVTRVQSAYYYDQKGDYHTKEYVAMRSIEGYKRLAQTSELTYLYKSVMNNLVICINKDKKIANIPVEVYQNQPTTDKEWVLCASAEGYRRMEKENLQIEKIYCINEDLEYVWIDKIKYYQQTGDKKLWKEVSINSMEGRRRISRKTGESKRTIHNSVGMIVVINKVGITRQMSILDYKLLQGDEWVSMASKEGHRRYGLEYIQDKKVYCVDINGDFVWVDKPLYKSQIGQKEYWKYVSISSKEGKRRLCLKNNKALAPDAHTGKTNVINLQGETKSMMVQEYKSQGDKQEEMEWCSVYSKEGKRRKHLNKK